MCEAKNLSIPWLAGRRTLLFGAFEKRFGRLRRFDPPKKGVSCHNFAGQTERSHCDRHLSTLS